MSERKLADRLSTMNESATLALNARVKQLAAEGKQVFNLTAGELAGDTPEYIKAYVSDKLHNNKYTAVAGMPELRHQIADMTRTYYRLDWIKPDNVLVTAGAKPALYVSFVALIDPGDEVIVPVPAWVSYNKLIELAGGKVVEIPLHEEYDLDVAAIAKHITPKTKAILLNSPQNPTGAVYSKSSLSKLADLLKGKGITVISDDIYSKLLYTDTFTPVPTIGFEHIVIISGFSKSQAITGWRIGYVIAEDIPLIKGMTGILSHTMGNAAVPSQMAALAAMEKNDTPPNETLDILKARRALVLKYLKGVEGLQFHTPEGAFYFFLDLRRFTHDSAKWCDALLEQTGVALVPGEAFSAPGFARLTFVTDDKTLEEALIHIRDFINTTRSAAWVF